MIAFYPAKDVSLVRFSTSSELFLSVGAGDLVNTYELCSLNTSTSRGKSPGGNVTK